MAAMFLRQTPPLAWIAPLALLGLSARAADPTTPVLVLENDLVLHPSWHALVSIWTRPHFEAWHPLHLMSYWIDVPWLGASGPVMHATSAILWAATCVLVLRVMRALGMPPLAAALAALAYGLHPMQVEAVTWATGRKDIVCAAFACLSILSHLRSDGPWDRWTWIGRAAFLLAALAKTAVLPLPVVLFLVDVLHRDRPWRQALLSQAPSLAIAAGLSVVVVGIWQSNRMLRDWDPGAGPAFTARLASATLLRQTIAALVPIRLSPLYPLDRPGTLGPWPLAVPALVMAFLAAAWRLKWRRPALVVLAYLALFLPVSNVLPLYWQRADRWMSLPLLPLAIGFGWAVERAASWAPAGQGARGSAARGSAVRMIAVRSIAVMAMAALAASTMVHVGAYTSDDRLWSSAVVAQPRAYYAWIKRGEQLRDSGSPAEAASAYREAIALRPDLALGHGALLSALAMVDEGRAGIAPSRAIALGEAFMKAEGDPDALRTMAGDMLSAGYRESILIPLCRSLDIDPLPDDRLRKAAAVQAANGNDFLAEFYLGRMSVPPPATSPR